MEPIKKELKRKANNRYDDQLLLKVGAAAYRKRHGPSQEHNLYLRLTFRIW